MIIDNVTTMNTSVIVRGKQWQKTTHKTINRTLQNRQSW